MGSIAGDSCEDDQSGHDRWRHLEDLDQIVGDPLLDPRFQQVPHRYLGLKTVASSIKCMTLNRSNAGNASRGTVSTRTSRSLSGRASPRARDPKTASLVTPSALIAGAISRSLAMISSRVMSATSLMA